MSESSKCIHGFLHDWRHLDTVTEYVEPADPEPLKTTTKDTWYCTRCLKIKTTERSEQS